jgi:sec-independent protein translocase protein TatB
MFDFAWTEIALIAVVALVAIGPKDLPVAIRAVTEMIKKARRMAGEFQTHMDDLVREANLDEVRSQINELRSFDIRGEVQRAVDPDGSLRSTLATNPLGDAFAATPSTAAPQPSEAAIGEHETATIEAPPDADPVPLPTPDPAPAVDLTPAWVPPGMVPKPVPAAPPIAAEAPAFVPPAFAAKRPAP